MGNKRIILLGLFTIAIFPLIGFIINYFFSSEPFWSIFFSKKGILLELLLGLCVGTVAGLFAWGIITTKLMQPVRDKYQGVIGSLKMNLTTIIIVSICAGVGEEILFRGILQSYFGIWLTAVFFVAIHGYLNPMDWRISLYGSYMTLAIALLGYLHQDFGLTSAMLAHTMIDIVLFIKLTNLHSVTDSTNDEDYLPEHPQSSYQAID